MANHSDAWNISNDKVEPSLLIHSDMSESEKKAMGSHQIRIDTLPLKTGRRLLHELLIQIVTEREVGLVNSEEILEEHTKKAMNSDAYKAIAAQDLSPTEREVIIRNILDQCKIPKVKVFPHEEQKTFMILGGAASGKTKLCSIAQTAFPENLESYIRITPDDIRNILAPREIFHDHHSDVAQMEASQLTEKIMQRITSRLASKEPCPHVMLDCIRPNEMRMELAHQSKELIVLSATCDPETTVQRSFERAHLSERFIPTSFVIDGQKSFVEHFPSLFTHPKCSFVLYDTNVAREEFPAMIAHGCSEEKEFSVVETKQFNEFLNRVNLNIHANGANELYINGQQPERKVEVLEQLTKQGMTILFQDNDGTNIATMDRDLIFVDSNKRNYLPTGIQDTLKVTDKPVLPISAQSTIKEVKNTCAQEVSKKPDNLDFILVVGGMSPRASRNSER